MKESIKKRTGLNEIGLKELMIEVARQAVVALSAFVASMASAFGYMQPFGLAFIATVPSEYLAL